MFLPEELGDRADLVPEQMRDGRLNAASPDLIVYVFANILWQRQKKSEVSGRLAASIMSDFERLPVRLVPGDVLGGKALGIAGKTGCTAYDGAFIALADELRCELLAADRRLVRLMSGTRFAGRLAWLVKWK